jgi:hypothetical protein
MASFRRLSLALVLTVSLATNHANSEDHATSHSVVPLSKISPEKWFVKVSGDLENPGEAFVIRIHNDAGYIVLPHTHPMDENITIVQRSWSVGMGTRFDRSALTPMEVGDYALVPKTMAHFGWSRTEMIQQVHGIGPFRSTLVDPAYELTDHGVLLLTSLLFPGRPTSSSPPDCFALKIGAKVHSDRGEGIIIGARCSPANQLTQYWVQKPNGDRFWATLEQLKPL